MGQRFVPGTLVWRFRHGFTLVELLVTICIVGILLSLLLPAIQAAREAGRQATCKNNLKQLGLAMANHESANRRFPSNGWGYRWIGDPDRGTGKQQPGSWIYNLLPYMEQEGLAEMGRGQQPSSKAESLTRLMSTPLSVLTCPTRGGEQPSPCRENLIAHNATWNPLVAKTDYAVNEGDHWLQPGPGPETLALGDSPSYPSWKDNTKASGICYQRSVVQVKDVKDGLSRTYLIGEKFVSTLDYQGAEDLGHDQSFCSGTCADVSRVVESSPLADIAAPYC